MREMCIEKIAEIGAIARSVGWGSAEILSHYHSQPPGELRIKHKQEGPVTNADIAASEYILRQLRIAFGTQGFGYLSEETYKTQSESDRLGHGWIWIIDPIDGTRAFIRRNFKYAVHIALVYEGRPVVAVVVLPEAGKLYYAHKNGGTFVEYRNGDREWVKVSPRDRLADLRILTRRSRKEERLTRLLHRLPGKIEQKLGSIGYKIASIVEQDWDIFISLSGKSAPKDWDLAAPELILTEAGGKLTHIDGTPLVYNKKDVSQWGCLVASNGQCHAEFCDQVATVLSHLDRGH
jgi:3'(2'), 5'-bisphosphate nucleotidase